MIRPHPIFVLKDMPHDSLKCLRCQQPLEAGCLVTPVHSGVGLLIHANSVEWHASPPKNGMWGVTLAEERFEISALRCRECGHIELLALDDSSVED